MIVVDASVLVVVVADDGPLGGHARERLRRERPVAPALVDLEVAAALRRQMAKGALGERRAHQALIDLVDAGVKLVPHRSLLGRVWQLRDNITPYDAAYVAVAEALDVPLLTADGRLARAPGVRCAVELLDASNR